jgi:hypothetical protein
MAGQRSVIRPTIMLKDLANAGLRLATRLACLMVPPLAQLRAPSGGVWLAEQVWRPRPCARTREVRVALGPRPPLK